MKTVSGKVGGWVSGRRLLSLTGLLTYSLTGLLLAGCTWTRMHCDPVTREARLWRLSVLQRVDIPELTIQSNGSVTLKGYRSDGGSEASAAITRAAVTAAIESSKP